MCSFDELWLKLQLQKTHKTLDISYKTPLEFSSSTQSTSEEMKSFYLTLFIFIHSSIAADWQDAGIKLNTKQVT